MKNAVATKNTKEKSTAASRARSTYRVNLPEGKETHEELLKLYLPIVKSIVARIKINLPPHIEEADLNSVGLQGLIAALRKYDPLQKKSFGSYAAMRIRGAILDELRRMDWMPATPGRISRSCARSSRNWNRSSDGPPPRKRFAPR